MKLFYGQKTIQEMGYSTRQLSYWNKLKQFIWADVQPMRNRRRYSWEMFTKLVIYHEIKNYLKLDSKWMSRNTFSKEIDAIVELIKNNIEKDFRIYIEIVPKNRLRVGEIKFFFVLKGEMIFGQPTPKMLMISREDLQCNYQLVAPLESEEKQSSRTSHGLRKKLAEGVRN